MGALVAIARATVSRTDERIVPPPALLHSVEGDRPEIGFATNQTQRLFTPVNKHDGCRCGECDANDQHAGDKNISDPLHDISRRSCQATSTRTKRQK